MESLFNWFVGIYRNIAITILAIILRPIDSFLKSIVPDLGSYFIQINTYLNNYLFKGLQFIKMVFFNLTNINPIIWAFFLSCFVVMLFVSLNFIVVKFGLNVWRIIQGTNGGKG